MRCSPSTAAADASPHEVRCVCVWREGVRRCRYTLYEVKEELLDAMGLNTEEDGSALQFLRRGYKTSTWWEDDEDVEKSDAWRT